MPSPQARQDARWLWSQLANELDQLYRHDDSFQQRVDVWTRLIDQYAAPDTLAIDVGCGTGQFSRYLAAKGCVVLALDPSAEMLAFCRRQLASGPPEVADRVRLHQAGLPELDGIDDRPGKLVISSSVLEYVPPLLGSLNRLCGLVQPGGVLLVSMPNRLSLGRLYHRIKYRVTGRPEIYGWIRHYATPGELAALVRPWGFTLLERHYYAHSSRPARWMRRLRLPDVVAADLFVAAFRRQGAPE